MSYRGNTYHPVAQFHNGTIDEFTIEFHRFWREKKTCLFKNVAEILFGKPQLPTLAGYLLSFIA
jgi:hypothetical protein